MRSNKEISQQHKNINQIYLFTNKSANNTINKANTAKQKKSQQKLPQIDNNHTNKQQRLHEVRIDVGNSKQNIEILKARIHSLRKQKHKNAKQIQWAKQKIAYISSIKNRLEEENKQKKQIQTQRQLENIYLRRRKSQLKHNHKLNKQQALNNLYTQKYQNSIAVRNEALQNNMRLHQFNQLLFHQNKQKVNQIHDMKKHIKQVREAYAQQISIQARRNYKQKLLTQREKKNKYNRTLKQLTNQEQSLIEELKMSQTTKLSQYKTLQNLLNPQSEVKGGNRSIYNKLFKKVFTSQKKFQQIKQ